MEVVKVNKIVEEDNTIKLYVIELQPKCWSTCSKLYETKVFDTERTLLLSNANIYKEKHIANKHCNNIKLGKFKGAMVVPLTFKAEYKVSDELVEKNLTKVLDVLNREYKYSDKKLKQCKDVVRRGLYSEVNKI